MGDIVILRIGHRPERDARITTHVGLTARALGAKGMLLDYDDKSEAQSIDRVVKAWGGDFYVKTGIGYRSAMKRWKEDGGVIAHLTMYGINLPDCIGAIRTEWQSSKNLLIVVGAEKVPGDVYDLADYNVAVGNQPHSEVAAVALFLDRLQEGQTLRQEFKGGELKIIPTEHGKNVRKEI